MPRNDVLPDQARALIIERILAGDTNKQINAALRERKLIASTRTVADNTLTPYRQSDDVRVQARRLNNEAMQVGHAALSDAIVANTNLLRESAKVLLPDGAFPATIDERGNFAEKIFFKSSKFLWDTLWQSGLPDSIVEEAKLRELVKRMEDADTMQESQRMTIVIEVRETLNRLLRNLVEERNRAAASGPQTAPVDKAIVSLVATTPAGLPEANGE